MSAQHTPGPWQVAVDIFDNDGMPETAIQAMNGGATVAVALDFGLNNPDMRQANARLIAAAPCLLDALQELTQIASVLEATCLGDSRAKENRMDRARAAIAKATGETK